MWDELQVRILDRERRTDADIRGAALQRLVADPDLADSLDVKVKDSWVTLTGTLDFMFQSDAVFEHVADLAGVTGVTDDIRSSNAADDMIPLSDGIPARRFPIVNVALIVACFAV